MRQPRWPYGLEGVHAKRNAALWGISWLLCVVVGCSSNNNLIAVTGEVTYQGKPLEQGSILFVSPQSRQVSGDIENGQIVNVTTLRENDGIAPGEYSVAISSYDRSEKYRNSMTPPSLIPSRYADFSSSGLKATIQPNSSNVLQFDLAK